jgi:hypothetical protein
MVAKAQENNEPIELKPLTIEEVTEALLHAIRRVRLDREDLITLLIEHSKVRRPGYRAGNTRLTRKQVKAALDAVEIVGKKYGRAK